MPIELYITYIRGIIILCKTFNRHDIIQYSDSPAVPHSAHISRLRRYVCVETIAYIYIYIYTHAYTIHVCMCVHIHIYIYIYREREKYIDYSAHQAGHNAQPLDTTCRLSPRCSSLLRSRTQRTSAGCEGTYVKLTDHDKCQAHISRLRRNIFSYEQIGTIGYPPAGVKV